MKILYIGNYTKIGDPLGYCPNAEYIAQSLRELGHEVWPMNECDYTPMDIIDFMKMKKFDLILTEEGRLKNDFVNNERLKKDILLQLFAAVMNEAREQGIPVVAWLTNIFHGVMRREIQLRTNPIFKADMVFTTDGGHQKEFEALDINHRLLRQGIYQHEAYIGKPVYPTKAEIVFVGAIYEHIWPYREKLVNFLKETYGDKFEHLGQRGDIRHDQLNNLCATAKIVVGDSVYSPHYWSNRVYEIIGRGGFLIHPRVAGLGDEFIYHKHIIPYDFGNFGQLKEIIDYYLSHEEEREKVRMAGFEHCKANHTYKHRVSQMLEVLEKEKIL